MATEFVVHIIFVSYYKNDAAFGDRRSQHNIESQKLEGLYSPANPEAQVHV